MLALSGLVPPWGGAISLSGTPVAGLEPPDVTARGLTLAPQGRRLFGAMSVEENLLMGCYLPALRRHAQADVGESIEEPGVHSETLAVNHPCLRRDGDVRTDSGDATLGDNHRGTLDRGARDRDHFYVLDGKISRFIRRGAALTDTQAGQNPGQQQATRRPYPQSSGFLPSFHGSPPELLKEL
jgi:ABC-type sugar transport system ATPase subunit